MLTILVTLKKTDKNLYYGYRNVFHGYISELLGNENYGTTVNDYTYSCLCGGECTKDGITFKNNPYFYIRTNSEAVWQNFLSNIKNKKSIFNGFNVLGFSIVKDNLEKNSFETDASSPILVSKKYRLVNNLSRDEIIDTEKYLVNSVFNKAKEMGIEVDDNLSIKIVRQRMHRDINYRGIINKGRNLKLMINCDRKTKEFILTHGLGRSTSCGFGFLI